MPDWYTLIKAARYLGVAPWELAEQPTEWVAWAYACQSAEAEAQPRQQVGGTGHAQPTSAFRGLS